MSSSFLSMENANAFLESNLPLLQKFLSLTAREIGNLDLDWHSGTVNRNSSITQLLVDNNLCRISDETATLTRAGTIFLGRTLLDYDSLLSPDQNKGAAYSIISKLKVGKNSGIFSAEHSILKHRVIIKIIRPGAAENLIESLQLLGRLDTKSKVVKPIDYFKLNVRDIVGQQVLLDSVVFPMVEGISFREFLSQQSYHLNSHVALSFVRQVGGALLDLEILGAYHGDLHDENIIVEETVNGELIFHLIDVSFGSMGSFTFEECKNGDLSNFKMHVWRLLGLQKSFLPNMSLRKFLGTRQFLTVTSILTQSNTTFNQLMSLLGNSLEYESFLESRKTFLNSRFSQPTTFRLQRYEEITDPSAAAKLFVPFSEIMAKVSEFSNVYMSGNRGSGKSTYLAALGCFPSAAEPSVDFRDIFGIYFPCRQGEFKALSAVFNKEERQTLSRTVTVLVVKIVRRTLEIIASAIAFKKVHRPSSYEELRTFLNRFVPLPGIVSVADDVLPEIQNFVSTMVRVEMELLASFNLSNRGNFANVELATLIPFFSIIRTSFTELSSSRFHILFDDAGYPNLPRNVQQVLCDLMLLSNPIFCIKFSAEKFTFAFESTEHKTLENGHDYFEHDVLHLLFIGSSSARLARAELEKYFRRIVEQRLEYFGYKSKSIVSYLGDNESIAEQLVGLLASGRRDARYAGWTAVWNIADRTPRNLLEIVSEIFAYGEVNAESEPLTISLKIQDKAIRTISDKRLQSLSQIAGYIKVGHEKISLGRRLFEVTTAIGSIFKTYLKAEAGKDRKRQHLAIERNDLSDLGTEAKEILERLISFGVLDDSKAEFARDDGVKKPIYVLNRIYCPAFGIIYRRDEHLRLSRLKFEMLLLAPEQFSRVGTKRLSGSLPDSSVTDDFFGYKDHE
jgi:serine/threonine protein kinase